MLRGQGFDVLDPRAAFAACPDKESLFLPDKHFSASGNRILLREVLRHCEGHREGHAVAARPSTPAVVR
jgi:hypothetical protein